MAQILTNTGALTERCHFCGVAITRKEVALEIEGSMTDYEEHARGEINITLCSGCREKLLAFCDEDQGDPIMRRVELEKDKPRTKIYIPEADESIAEDVKFGTDVSTDTGTRM